MICVTFLRIQFWKQLTQKMGKQQQLKKNSHHLQVETKQWKQVMLNIKKVIIVLIFKWHNGMFIHLNAFLMFTLFKWKPLTEHNGYCSSVYFFWKKCSRKPTYTATHFKDKDKKCFLFDVDLIVTVCCWCFS